MTANSPSKDMATADQLAFATVRIECETDNGLSVGTGFFYHFNLKGDIRTPEATSHSPGIITNRHVIAGCKRVRFNIHLEDLGLGHPVRHERFELEMSEAAWVPHPDPEVDLCALGVGKLKSDLEQEGKKLYFKTIGSELIPSRDEWDQLRSLEEVVMVGYPNGLWDSAHNMPIFRRGITATHPRLNYGGRQEFLIDAACYPGSSGSPVFRLSPHTWWDSGRLMSSKRLTFLGVMYGGPVLKSTGEIVMMKIPGTPRPVAVHDIPINLGLVIKSVRLLEFDAFVTRWLELGGTSSMS